MYLFGEICLQTILWLTSRNLVVKWKERKAFLLYLVVRLQPKSIRTKRIKIEHEFTLHPQANKGFFQTISIDETMASQENRSTAANSTTSTNTTSVVDTSVAAVDGRKRLFLSDALRTLNIYRWEGIVLLCCCCLSLVGALRAVEIEALNHQSTPSLLLVWWYCLSLHVRPCLFLFFEMSNGAAAPLV